MGKSLRPRRLLFLITEDWFFYSHFLERAIAARTEGYDVTVVTRATGHQDKIQDHGFRMLHIPFDRRGLNPFGELATLWRIVRTYRTVRPDVVHHIALKPITYGTLAAKLTGIRVVINAPVGMGYVFTSHGRLARMLRPVVWAAMRWLLNPRGSRVVFENPDDLESMVAAGVVQRDAGVLIRGAGVDLDRFRPTPEPAGIPVVTFVGRMLWDKGVGEFAAAARQLRKAGVVAHFRLVGMPDPANPAAIEVAQLESWHAEGVVDWLGHRTDIPELLASSHVVCLPSYREGLPKSLLEALAAGRPVVATDVAGCREAVHHEDNGLLVASRDSVGLAAAIRRLIENPDLRQKFGARGRQRAEAEFASPLVCEATLALYREVMLES